MKLMRNEWLRVANMQLRPNLIVVVLVALGLLGMTPAKMAHAQAMSTTTVQGTLYMANGQTGSGTLQVSWPSFTAAGGQAVVAGNTTVAVGSDGFVSVNLTPNVGATPAGLYYTAVFYLSNGTTTTQYWVVPAAAQATLAQVQSQVMPAAQAVQAVSKAYVDEAIAEAGQSQLSSSGETMSGPLYLNADPTQAMQAADKHYVDVSVSQSSTQPGMAGQIAYYTGTGTAIAGMNAVPVAAGGTGAGNAAGGLQNLGGLSVTATGQQAMAGGLSVAGTVAAQAVTASVNSQLNVMAPPYNAKGDCLTDDSVAIQNALNMQKTSTAQITVYFPAPPGGCYLTSTLTFTGASMQGQAGAGFVGETGASVVIQGKPGQDIVHELDPTTAGSVGPRAGWAIRDIVFNVDASVDASASFPHRWPGMWDQTCGITASSHTLSCSKFQFSCADIGQNILVKGAGAAGADLLTTIANVTPCWVNYGASGPTVTLTAAASTTVSNHYAYLTPAGIPLTQHIGNCAFAADNYDGKASDWVITGSASNWAPSFWNVTFASINSVAGNFNNTCGIYFGAAYNPYLSDAKDLTFWNVSYGIVQGMPDTNPASAGIGQDYQKWDHGLMLATYPWISINDGELTWTDYQLRSNNGPQILKYNANNEPQPTGWKLRNPEMESSGSGIGYRIEGGSGGGAATMQIDGTELSAGKTAYLMTKNARYHDVGGNLVVGGSNNWIDGPGISNNNVTNLGMDNIIDAAVGGTSSGMDVTTEQTQTLNRGRGAFGTLTTDFIRNGTAPYYNDHDLFFWPQDFTDTFGAIYSVVADTNSWTGNYVMLPSGADFYYFNNMYMLQRGTGGNPNQIVAGQNIPVGPVQVSFSYKCPSITSFTAMIKAIGASPAVLATATPFCSTSYQTATMPVADFTSYAGYALDLAISAGEVDIAWMAIKPYGALTITSATIPGATSGSYVKADGTGYGIPSSGVTQISAGTNVSISPSVGTGNVTINANSANTLPSYGTLVNQTTWASLANYTANGTTPTVSGGALNFSGGAPTWLQTLDWTGPQGGYTTTAPLWTMQMNFTVGSPGATTYGLGIGIRSTNSLGNLLTTTCSMDASNMATRGQVYLDQYNGSAHQVVAPTSALTFSAGDSIQVTFNRTYDIVTCTIADLTTPAAAPISTFTFSQAYSPSYFPPNVGTFSIFNFGGNEAVTAFSVSLLTPMSAQVAFVGDSKTVGMYQTFNNGFSNQFPNSVTFAGAGDTTTDVLSNLQEIIAHKPQNVILSIGRNDVCNGVSLATAEANYTSIVNQLQAASINVYHLILWESYCANSTTFNNWVISNYPASAVINPMLQNYGASVVLAADNIHPSPMGGQIVTQAITRFMQGKTGLNQFQYLPPVSLVTPIY